jgi:hypothetical protein
MAVRPSDSAHNAARDGRAPTPTVPSSHQIRYCLWILLPLFRIPEPLRGKPGFFIC